MNQGSASSETDAVAEVIEERTGHNGVKVDNADTLIGLVVDHDVVELGVVMPPPATRLFQISCGPFPVPPTACIPETASSVGILLHSSSLSSRSHLAS